MTYVVYASTVDGFSFNSKPACNLSAVWSRMILILVSVGNSVFSRAGTYHKICIWYCCKHRAPQEPNRDGLMHAKGKCNCEYCFVKEWHKTGYAPALLISSITVFPYHTTPYINSFEIPGYVRSVPGTWYRCWAAPLAFPLPILEFS